MMLHKYGHTKLISVMFRSHCSQLTVLSSIGSRAVWQVDTTAPEEEMSPRRSIKFRPDNNGLWQWSSRVNCLFCLFMYCSWQLLKTTLLNQQDNKHWSGLNWLLQCSSITTCILQFVSILTSLYQHERVLSVTTGSKCLHTNKSLSTWTGSKRHHRL
jgi:hypothetical protein